MLFGLLVHSTFDTKIVSNFDSESDVDSDAYFAVAAPETPISLKIQPVMEPESLHNCVLF